MELDNRFSADWRGRLLAVHILYSRAGVAQHIWVEDDRDALLVDAADGVLRDILERRMNLRRLRAIIITHGHFDHMGGLHSLFGFLRMIGREEPLLIAAPEGSTETFSVIANFIRLYEDSLPFKIISRGLRDRETVKFDSLEISGWPVIHCGSTDKGGIGDPIPAFGYRISSGGDTVAITGDTGAAATLEPLVSGADLAIIEATYKTDGPESIEARNNVHLTEEEARRLGGLAQDYILVHRVTR